MDQLYQARGTFLKSYCDDQIFGEAKGENHPIMLGYYRMMSELAEI